MKTNKILGIVVILGLISLKTWADIDSNVGQGWDNYHAHKYVDAMSNFKKTIKTNPSNVDALVGMAYAEFKLGRYFDVLTHIKASEKINPKFQTIKEKITLPGVEGEFEIEGNGKSLLGWSYYLLGYTDESIKILSAVVQSHPDWVASRHGLGLAFVQKGKLQEAKKQFEEIKKSGSKYAGADIGLSTVSAITTYQAKTTELGSLYKAWYQLNLGNYKAAVGSFNAILQNTTQRVSKEEMWRVHLGLGWGYYWLGNYTNAHENFRVTLNENSWIADARKGMGFCEYKLKKYQKSVSELKRYLEEVPGDSDAISTIGWSYYNTKDYSSAIKEFGVLTTNYPLLAEPHMALTLTYYEIKDFNHAKESLMKAVNLYPWYVDGAFKKMLSERSDWASLNSDIGWTFYYKADYKKAATFFESAPNKGDKNTLRGLAFSYWQLAKNDEAISLLNKVLKLQLTKDDKVEALNSLGWSYYNKKQYNDAIETFNQSVQIYEHSMEALRGLGWAYYRKKDYQNSISFFERLAKDYPLLADARNGLGWNYYSKNSLTQSAEEFDHCLLLMPGHYEAQLGLSKINKNFIKMNEAWYLYSIGYINKALGRFMAAVDKLPPTEKWRAHLGMAWCYYSLYQGQKALSIFKDKVLTVKKDEPMALKGVGFTHYALQQYAESIPYLEKFASQYPLSSEGQGYLSWACLRAGQYDQALKHFNKLAEQYPLLPEAQGGLAIAYFKLNHPEKAHEHMLKAVNLSSVIVNLPDYQEMLEAHTDWSDLFEIAGWGYLNSYYYVEAEKYFNLALIHNSDDVEVQRGLGLAYYYMRNYNKAVETLSQVAKGMKDSEDFWGKKSVVFSALGWSYYFIDQNENSIQAFQKLIDLHASNDIYADPHDGLGWNYLKMKSYQKAKDSFNKALALAPLYASPKRGLAATPSDKTSN